MSDLSYSDSSAPSEAQSGDAAPDEQEADNSALLPKSILGSKECKVGSTITLKIDAIHDAEIEVSPVDDSQEEKGETGSAMDQAKSGLDNYAKTPEQM